MMPTPGPRLEVERLERERAEIEESLIEARTEVDRLERERARVHDAIGALIGVPCPTRPVDAVPAPLPTAAPTGRERCPDALLPDGPTCPRCGGPRAPWDMDGRRPWVHFPAPEPGL